jgi:TPR repeat protein
MALRDHIWKYLVAAPLCMGLSGLVGTARATDIEDAVRFYDSGQYVLAVDRFRAAAGAGDARAQEILGFMYALGSEVYPGVPHDVRAAAHWFDLAARNGRQVSRYVACAMQRDVLSTRVHNLHCFDWILESGKPGSR